LITPDQNKTIDSNSVSTNVHPYLCMALLDEFDFPVRAS